MMFHTLQECFKVWEIERERIRIRKVRELEKQKIRNLSTNINIL